MNVIKVRNRISIIYCVKTSCDKLLYFIYRSPEVHQKAINTIRNLMTAHDIDSRFSGNINQANAEVQGQKKISMVANLYLPIIAICLDNLPKVYRVNE